MSLSLAITPSGHLRVEDVPAGQPAVAEAAASALRRAFGQSSGDGLLALASDELDRDLPAEFVFWRGFGRTFFEHLCRLVQAKLLELQSCLFHGQHQYTASARAA